jgi:hypothetical protein
VLEFAVRRGEFTAEGAESTEKRGEEFDRMTGWGG